MINTITGEAVNVSPNIATSIAEIELSAGTYILLASAYYGSNATGYRRLNIKRTQNSTGNVRGESQTCVPVNGSASMLQAIKIHTASETTKYYCTVSNNF